MTHRNAAGAVPPPLTFLDDDDFTFAPDEDAPGEVRIALDTTPPPFDMQEYARASEAELRLVAPAPPSAARWGPESPRRASALRSLETHRPIP